MSISVSFRGVHLACIIGVCLMSCNKPKKNEVIIESKRLPALQEDNYYCGWLVTQVDTINVGYFNIKENGNLTTKAFIVNPNEVKLATSFGISIEMDNTVTNPSGNFIVAGDFNGDEAILTSNHSSSLQQSFENATGTYLTATVTDAIGITHEYSGVWWVTDLTAPNAGLSLPNLPPGWIYEGWVKINGKYLSTGRFSDPNQADNCSNYGDFQNPSLNFPGEDLLFDAPLGFVFPVNLKSSELIISIESINSSNDIPLLPVLEAIIPSEADYNTAYFMTNVSTNFPIVTVYRND